MWRTPWLRGIAAPGVWGLCLSLLLLLPRLYVRLRRRLHRRGRLRCDWLTSAQPPARRLNARIG